MVLCCFYNLCLLYIIYFYVYNFILESFMFIPFMFSMCAANRKIIWLDTEYSTNWDSRINMYICYDAGVYRFDLLVFWFVCIYSEYKMMTIEMKNCVVFPNGLWSTYSDGLRFHTLTKVTLEYIRRMECHSLKMGGTMWPTHATLSD